MLENYNKFCIFLFLLIKVTSSQKIIYTGKNEVEEGQPFTIKCVLTEFDVLKWTKDKNVINTNNDEYQITISHENSVNPELFSILHVERARVHHSGEYRCTRFSSTFHRIDVISKPDDGQDSEYTEVILTENKTTTLLCNIGEDSAFPVSWFFEGHKVLTEQNPRINVQGRTLTISPSHESDAGNYTCDTISAFSYPLHGRGHVIHLKSRAKVLPFPSQFRIQVGTDLREECKAFGYPKPWITWYIGNITAQKKQKKDPRIEILPNSHGYPNAILLWRNISFEDRQIITCKVTNSVNSATSSALLVVRANSIITNEKEQGKGIMMEKGKDLTLKCNDTSTVSTDITWYKDGVMINATGHKISVLPENSTLVIHEPEVKDAGKYTCVSDSSNNYTFYVYAKIQIEQFPKSLNLVQGDTLNLHCEVKGYPLPRITWYKDDELVNTTDERVELMADKSNISNAKLVIKDLDYEDRAVYMCLADNGISDPVNATVLVRVKDKLAALWPFLGICAEVAILCAIIFIYEKKRVKPDFDESDTDQIPESKNVADKDKVPDVRQRK